MNTTSMNIQAQLERAAGLDVHQNKITVYFYIRGTLEEVQNFGTFTCDLEQIRDALQKHQIKDVIMESTGIYWISLCSILTGAGINVRVVNPRFVANMPKEKTDTKDAKWLCKLLVNGLVRSSFVASEEQRAFRDLCRQRTKYSQHITQTTNRVLKNLERRNIKLRSVVSSMRTKSSMDIIHAIANGETDIEKMVLLCKGKLIKKRDAMRKALQGVITQHDRDMLKTLLKDIAHYKEQIKGIEEKICQHTDKVNKTLIENLQQIKGIGKQSTEVILAEVGDNVNAFSTADKLAAWVGLAPGNKESAGKSRYAGTRQGNVYLRTAMIQAAWGAVRTKNSYWRALFAHLIKRMHAKKAIVVIARKLMKIIYKVIKGVLEYKEYGAEYFIEKLLQRRFINKGAPFMQGT